MVQLPSRTVTDTTTGGKEFTHDSSTVSQTTNGDKEFTSDSPTASQTTTDDKEFTHDSSTVGQTTTGGIEFTHDSSTVSQTTNSDKEFTSDSSTVSQTTTDDKEFTHDSSTVGQTTTGAIEFTSDSTTVSQTTTKASSTQTPFVCTEIDYIESLIATNAVRIRPNDQVNKQDLITEGLDFTDNTPTVKIDLPDGGLIIRDVKIPSLNIINVEIVFVPESGAATKSIKGKPTSLPIDEIPTERIGEIIIKIDQTSDGGSPKQVTLSILACAETFTKASTRKC